MSKLTHYTSFEDMKSSKNFNPSAKNLSQKESELKAFITLLKTHEKVIPVAQTKLSNKGGK
jgi:hypothetical protein